MDVTKKPDMNLGEVFTEEEQEAFVGHCLKEYKFFLKCKDKIGANWFKNPAVGQVYSALIEVYKRDGKFITSVEEFRTDDIFRRPGGTKALEMIPRCLYTANKFSLERIIKKLTGWMRVSLFKQSAEGAVRLYNSRGFDEAFNWTKEHIKLIQEATFEDLGIVMSMKDPATWLIQDAKTMEAKVSTGSTALDTALGGGLFKGETCAILAPSNSGKTTLMMTLVRHLVFQKKSVLFMIHEGDARTLRQRLLCAYMGITKNTLFNMIQKKEGIEIVTAVSNIIDEYLTFVPYIKSGGMYCEDVIQLIKQLNDERIASKGSGYDVVINDYPKKLKMRANMGNKNELYRASLAEIYDQFNFLASEINVHCFVAVQVNREGAKDNSGKNETKTLLSMENADESYGIVQNLANIISLNRSPEDKANGIARLSITKSRNGATDITVNTKTDYACALVYGDDEMFEFGNAWEKDIASLPSKIQNDNKKYESVSVLASLNDPNFRDKNGNSIH